MLTALLIAAQAAAAPLPDRIVNPGFEDDLRGWSVTHVRGMAAEVDRNPGYGLSHAAQGRFWLTVGWRGRAAAPRDAALRVTTRLGARRYRGRTIRVSAMTRAPDFADRAARLFVRGHGRSGAGAEAAITIAASDGWRRQSVDMFVPRDTSAIELGFIVPGRRGQLDADSARVEVLR